MKGGGTSIFRGGRPTTSGGIARVGARLPVARAALRLRIRAGPEALASRAAVTFPIRQVALTWARYPDAWYRKHEAGQSLERLCGQACGSGSGFTRQSVEGIRYTCHAVTVLESNDAGETEHARSYYDRLTIFRHVASSYPAIKGWFVGRPGRCSLRALASADLVWWLELVWFRRHNTNLIVYAANPRCAAGTAFRRLTLRPGADHSSQSDDVARHRHVDVTRV